MRFPRNKSSNSVELQEIAFAGTRLTGEETHYSYIEKEILGILHGQETFHKYCFASEVSMIIDHKQQVAVYWENITSLITQASKNTIENTPIQQQNTI